MKSGTWNWHLSHKQLTSTSDKGFSLPFLNMRGGLGATHKAPLRKPQAFASPFFSCDLKKNVYLCSRK